jgi:DNA-binding MarR family transcriptional regulator
MRSTSPVSEHELASRLRVDLARVARRLRQAADSGLSPTQTSALASIERCGPMTPSELATVERVQRPTVTRLLGRLEELGLVSRTPDPADGRSTLLTVTAAGSELLASARTRKDVFLSERLAGLSAADRATLERAAELLEGMLE